MITSTTKPAGKSFLWTDLSPGNNKRSIGELPKLSWWYFQSAENKARGKSRLVLLCGGIKWSEQWMDNSITDSLLAGLVLCSVFAPGLSSVFERGLSSVFERGLISVLDDRTIYSAQIPDSLCDHPRRTFYSNCTGVVICAFPHKPQVAVSDKRGFT